LRWLIDGYNLMHAAGLVPPAARRRSAHPVNWRQALLQFLDQLVDLLGPQAARTTIVFDAGRCPLTTPRATTYHDLRVLFATDVPDADQRIIELIRSDTAPRHLTVVSSDRDIVREAKRRRAVTVDSDRFWQELLTRQQKARTPLASEGQEKPVTVSPEEAKRFLAELEERPRPTTSTRTRKLPPRPKANRLRSTRPRGPASSSGSV
jgi:predicted RNA-binding protein with PIN domain